jgi:hypothetical protein
LITQQDLEMLTGFRTPGIYKIRTVQFWITEIGSIIKTSIMKFSPEELFWMILMQKFWLY